MKISIVLTLLLLPACNISAGSFEFRINYIDSDYGGNGKPGWVRSGDLDGDGDTDIIAGGGNALYAYENNGFASGWKRHGNLDRTAQMGANGAVLFDVDSDGDFDVVSAKYYGPIGWWENPGGRLANAEWKFHHLFDANRFLHDLILVDLDNDGKRQEFVANLNSGYWAADLKILWFRHVSDLKSLEFGYIDSGRNEGELHGHAGLAADDINLDGNIDIAYSNGWYQAPDNPKRRWIWHSVADIYGISNTVLEDMDKDGDPDIIVSAGHHGRGVYWFENILVDQKNEWKQHTVDNSIVNPEGLAVADVDRDGDFDIIGCELNFKQWDRRVHNVYLWEFRDGSSNWKRYNIAPKSYPSHQLQLADINRDGKLDFISEGAGFGVVTYFENHSRN